jgi:hypothetical protein
VTPAETHTVRRDRFIASGIVVSFFLPYIYGGILRVDHFVAFAAMAYVVFRFLRYRTVPIAPEFVPFLVLSLAACLYATLRLFIGTDNVLLSIQYSIQYSYLFAGAALFVFVRDNLRDAASTIVSTLAFIGIVVNVIALVQFVFVESPFVYSLLDLYGGKQYEPGTYGKYSSKAAEILLGGRQAISVFTGMQALALFDLFNLALLQGVLRDKTAQRNKAELNVAWFGICAAILGGLLTASKTFVFGFGLLMALLAVFDRRSLPTIFIAVVIFFVTAEVVRHHSYQLNDILTHTRRLDGGELLASRYGRNGYLTEVMSIMQQPRTWIIGLGSEAARYRYADNQFRQIVLVGGLPLFGLYYAAVLSLLYASWRTFGSSGYAKVFFALGLVYLAGGVGIDVHFHARVIILWVLTQLLLVERGMRGNISPLPSSADRRTQSRTL